MKIAFVTTMTLSGSTNVGRVLPLARELAASHEVHLLAHESEEKAPEGVNVHFIGKDPFVRTARGKQRLSGFSLLLRMKWNAWKQMLELFAIQPDVVVIVKPLPQNVLAVWWWHVLARKRIILDVDDFELTANTLTSMIQRAAIHWSERMATRLADSIAVATPFLSDHFSQLAAGTKDVVLVPTGISKELIEDFGAHHTSGHSQNNILYLGSVSRSSGHRVDLLPDILKRVRQHAPDATLTIAGSGDDVEELKSAFAAQGITDSVTWHGRFAPEEVPALVSRASVMIDPVDASTTNRAKSSYRVLVGGAAGVPVVTSDIGIRPVLIPESLHSQLFADPADAASYAKHIIDILQAPLNDSQRQTLISHTTRFSWHSLVQQYPIGSSPSA